ncbi:aminotransferase class I/II-fold pyridoxal phosphate-dependent enzyme [Pseudonocardia sp. HH130630-07]|uniref:aminotransferase class I/II-fold pyridoxal phosphate-dependent enzyme n=1 Tax=Pseudonocardia sp. HH130630-07 TaxID=1690815 RepID=UPI0012E9D9B8|nr:aminotransferase class I/II-fold pyridoxal phosphate-dependent enzyme [Pseudonocardia sp. HH130630-07]
MTPVAPLADAVAGHARERWHNFHALPLTAMIDELPDRWRAAYAAVLAPGADLSLSGAALDSPFRPSGPLAQAQRRAARFFGADDTLFVTGGTTLANHIALDAALESGPGEQAAPPVVVLDPSCHQSVFFAAHGAGATVLPAPSGLASRGTRRLDADATVELLGARHRSCRPVAAVVLTAAPYDGSRLALDRVLPALVAASPRTVFVVDEAWAAAHALHPRTAAASTLSLRSEPARLIVTQSAHKTLLALRQGAYVHVAGEEGLVAAVRRAFFRRHTSSPSWPVLASLDLARAHAELEGREAVARALARRDRLVAGLRDDPRTRELVPTDGTGGNPMMVSLRLSDGVDASAVRRTLLEEHRVVLARAVQGSLLAHVHIGVTDADVDALTRALRAIATVPAAVGPHWSGAVAEDGPAVGTVLDGFLVTYPPGVPLAGPGDTWTTDHAQVLAAHRRGGSEVFLVPVAR